MAVTDDLINALKTAIPANLAKELVDDFVQIRQDVALETLGRVNAGKFVESVVQILQYLDTGLYDKKPSVDHYLRTVESSATQLPDGLRICASRVARSMYTLRNKRNTAHKGEIDPNRFVLIFLFNAAQWVMAEISRTVAMVSMEESGKIVREIEAPAGSLLEDFGEKP